MVNIKSLVNDKENKMSKVEKLVEKQLTEASRDLKNLLNMIKTSLRTDARVEKYGSGHAIELGANVSGEFVIDRTLVDKLKTEAEVIAFLKGFLVAR